MPKPESRMRETPVARLKIEFAPILSELDTLQTQYGDLITELQKFASAGQEVRTELASALSIALEMSQKARAMDRVSLIKNRKFASEPSSDNLEAVSLANRKNAVPDGQKEIQMILHTPKYIMEHYEQLIASAQEGIDISNLIKAAVEQSKEQLLKFKIFLEEQ